LPERISPDKSTRRLLLTLGLGVFAGALDLNVLAPALPVLARSFGVVTGDLAWIFTLYLLVNVAAIVVAGTLADRYGRRRIYQLSMGMFALGSAVTVLAPTYDYFLLGRALLALGAGGLFPVATAAVGDVVPPSRRGAALGTIAATWGLAAILGPAIGGVVTHFLPWQWIFAANFPLAAIVLWLSRRYVPVKAPQTRGPIDALGLVLLCCGLLAVVDALLSVRAEVGAVGVVLLAAFFFRERRSTNPILPFSLLRTSQLWKAYLLEIAIGVLEGSLFFIPTVIVSAQHVSTAIAGGIAALGALVFVAVIPFSGRALDRVGSRDVLFAGCLFTEVGLAIFALGFDSMPLTVLAMIVAGLGFGALLGAPTRYIVTNETGASTRATAVGLLSQSLIVGQILGSALIGSIIGNLRGEAAGYRFAYLTACGIALLALFITSTLRGRTTERAVPLQEAAP
jgi:MFS family permease